MESQNPPLLIVLSAPSGAGKTTICREIMKTRPNLRYSISVTTRPPRRDEIEGVDYYFVSLEKFRQMVERGELLEWALVHDHYYGTPRKFVENTLTAGLDVILDIDVQGGLKVKRIYPTCILIFVASPSMETLEKRLRGRKTDSEEVIRKRLINAVKEMEYIKEYDYLIVNDVLSRAVEQLRAIIAAEKCRVFRLNQGNVRRREGGEDLKG